MKRIKFLTIVFFLFALTPARPARADSVGAVVIGAVVAVVALGAVSAVATSQRDVARIEADKRVRLEEIRSGTVLDAPCALGGKGQALYNSSEGFSEIKTESQLRPEDCRPRASQVGAQQPVPGSGYGYGRPSCQRGDWELRQTPFGARWTCSSTGEML